MCVYILKNMFCYMRWKQKGEIEEKIQIGGSRIKKKKGKVNENEVAIRRQ